jgi:hypothetical protein
MTDERWARMKDVEAHPLVHVAMRCARWRASKGGVARAVHRSRPVCGGRLTMTDERWVRSKVVEVRNKCGHDG